MWSRWIILCDDRCRGEEKRVRGVGSWVATCDAEATIENMLRQNRRRGARFARTLLAGSKPRPSTARTRATAAFSSPKHLSASVRPKKSIGAAERFARSGGWRLSHKWARQKPRVSFRDKRPPFFRAGCRS